LLSVNRPARGTLTIAPPSGAPSTFAYEFTAPSSFPKTFSTANQPTGRWTVNFQADDYCSGFSSGVAYFDVSPNTYDVSISLSGVPGSVTVNIQVDGVSQGSMTGSDIKTLTFKIGEQHSISVDQYVQGDQGIRYYSSQNTWTVSSAGSHTFTYQAQYFLTVGTDPDGITRISGGGWNNAGSIIQTGTAPQIVNGSAGTQYLFKGWQVDGVLQPSTSNPQSLTSDKPHRVIAKYQIQYQLVVDSPGGLGRPQGSGYYDAGSTAQFSVTSPTGLLIQQIFARWQGDYSGISPQASIVMDKPHVVRATWTTSYTQLYMAVATLAAVAVSAFLFLLRRRKGRTVTKPTPPAPPAESKPVVPGEEKPAETPPAAKSVTCSSCGATMPAGLVYCTECGSKFATED
jgi:hypothetical protein